MEISILLEEIGGKMLFADANLFAKYGEKIALIGDNGCGKTTFLRILAGEIQPQNGQILSEKIIGFLRQENDFSGNVYEFFASKIDMESEFWRAEIALEKVGISTDNFVEFSQKMVADFSGGEKTKLALARILTEENLEILLLDEPTNNLDADSRKWLESFLEKWNGTVIFASHDRFFIDQTAEKIWEISDEKIREFRGNYMDFLSQKKLERRRQQDEFAQFDKEKKKLEALEKLAKIKMNSTSNSHYSRKSGMPKIVFNARKDASQKSTGKKISAFQSKISQLQNDKNVREKPFERKDYFAKLSDEQTRKNGLVLRAENIAKNYGKREIFANINLEIRAGEKMRITGKNGTGKSTLLKILAGKIKPEKGEIKYAQNIKIGYVSQDAFGIKNDETLAENFANFDREKVMKSLRVLDFVVRDYRRKIGEFSRGQQTKIAILKLILDENDLLILDEITNHIDIRAREKIENMLKNYAGSVIFATHDEYFSRIFSLAKTVDL